MKFKIDENLPFIFKKIIENHGNHQVDSVFHENLTGIDDRNLLQTCLKDERILITLDADFIHMQIEFYGIIVLRSKTQGKKAVRDLFSIFLSNFPLEDVVGKKIIIEPNVIRIRY